jgi:hypothetical protein
MNQLRTVGCGMLAAGLVWSGVVLGQEGEVGVAEREGQVVATQSEGLGMPSEVALGVRLSEQLRERVRNFEQLRLRFLEQQRELTQQMKGASASEREKIRQQIRENRQEWVEQARQVRERARERVEELKESLPRHGDLLEAARERARERARDGVQGAQERGRRGTD